MTAGVLIFAFNNEAIDYVNMARWSATRIHRHLDLPVAVVTDGEIDHGGFDQVIMMSRSHSESKRHFQDLDGEITWFNQDRTSALDLSPWDQTLVLDADYVVASDQLRYMLDLDLDFICHRSAYDVTGKDMHALNYFGNYRMPMHWATVMMFRRSELAQDIFDCMDMIKKHWPHYTNLYGLGRSMYRNDFALSIALAVVYGHVPRLPGVAYSLASVMPDHQLAQIGPDHFRVGWKDQQARPRWIDLRDQDFHAMCKGQLGDVIANPS